jgi:hypothetical protein
MASAAWPLEWRGVTLDLDARLLFDDQDVAKYLRQAFEIDWARESPPAIPQNQRLPMRRAWQIPNAGTTNKETRKTSHRASQALRAFQRCLAPSNFPITLPEASKDLDDCHDAWSPNSFKSQVRPAQAAWLSPHMAQPVKVAVTHLAPWIAPPNRDNWLAARLRE